MDDHQPAPDSIEALRRENELLRLDVHFQQLMMARERARADGLEARLNLCVDVIDRQGEVIRLLQRQLGQRDKVPAAGNPPAKPSETTE